MPVQDDPEKRPRLDLPLYDEDAENVEPDAQMRLINDCFPIIFAIFLPSTLIPFTKLKFRQSFWGAEQVYILIGSKVVTQKAKIFISVFLQFCKKDLICVMLFVSFVFFACLLAFLFVSQLLNQLRYRPLQHHKMTISTSVLCEIFI